MHESVTHWQAKERRSPCHAGEAANSLLRSGQVQQRVAMAVQAWQKAALHEAVAAAQSRCPLREMRRPCSGAAVCAVEVVAAEGDNPGTCATRPYHLKPFNLRTSKLRQEHQTLWLPITLTLIPCQVSGPHAAAYLIGLTRGQGGKRSGDHPWDGSPGAGRRSRQSEGGREAEVQPTGPQVGGPMAPSAGSPGDQPCLQINLNTPLGSPILCSSNTPIPSPASAHLRLPTGCRTAP